MAAQTFTISNPGTPTVTQVKLIFPTINVGTHTADLSNLGGSSAFTGSDTGFITLSSPLANGQSVTFDVDYAYAQGSIGASQTGNIQVIGKTAAASQDTELIAVTVNVGGTGTAPNTSNASFSSWYVLGSMGTSEFPQYAGVPITLYAAWTYSGTAPSKLRIRYSNGTTYDSNSSTLLSDTVISSSGGTGSTTIDVTASQTRAYQAQLLNSSDQIIYESTYAVVGYYATGASVSSWSGNSAISEVNGELIITFRSDTNANIASGWSLSWSPTDAPITVKDSYNQTLSQAWDPSSNGSWTPEGSGESITAYLVQVVISTDSSNTKVNADTPVTFTMTAPSAYGGPFSKTITIEDEASGSPGSGSYTMIADSSIDEGVTSLIYVETTDNSTLYVFSDNPSLIEVVGGDGSPAPLSMIGESSIYSGYITVRAKSVTTSGQSTTIRLKTSGGVTVASASISVNDLGFAGISINVPGSVHADQTFTVTVTGGNSGDSMTITKISGPGAADTGTVTLDGDGAYTNSGFALGLGGTYVYRFTFAAYPGQQTDKTIEVIPWTTGGGDGGGSSTILQ